jgi:hypothetical protein
MRYYHYRVYVDGRLHREQMGVTSNACIRRIIYHHRQGIIRIVTIRKSQAVQHTAGVVYNSG